MMPQPQAAVTAAGVAYFTRGARAPLPWPKILRMKRCSVVVGLSWALVAAAAPNRVEVSPRLVTSGQPTAAELGDLGAQGYGAVIYLAPPSVPDAVADEARIVGRQGLVFVNLPIRFDAPTAADVEAFNALVQALAPRKLLVHCQINLRASTLVFLYRSTALREDPRLAWESVSRVWTPEGPWRNLVEQTLARHHIVFDPF
jgi:protein tyrosine phosphatase (PTP) superfamily phosphohydrolase (DUF442 family)